MKFKAKLADESVNVSKTPVLKEFSTLLISFAVLLLIVLAISFSFVNIAVPFIPFETEKAMFSVFRTDLDDSNFFGLGEVHSSPKLKALVTKLANHWEKNPYDFAVGVLETDAINAMALPGGTILVTKGLLDIVESENELAFVLAHEIGHFHNRDALKSLSRGLIGSLVLGLVGQSTQTLSNVVGSISTSSYNRRAETKADSFGLELMQATYGTVSGSTELFKKLAENENIDLFSLYNRSHPFSNQRVNDMVNLANKNHWTLNGILLPKPDIFY